jgi:hypothetical protein
MNIRLRLYHRRKPRARRRRPEQKIQMDVVKWCRNNLAPCVIFWATNNNSASRSAGARNKAMGVLPGVPDLIFSYKETIYFLELKSLAGKKSPAQDKFLKAMNERGHVIAVAIGYNPAIAIIQSWSFPYAKKERVDWEARGL